MSRTSVASTGKRYGLARVCAAWKFLRSTYYAQRNRSHSPVRRVSADPRPPSRRSFSRLSARLPPVRRRCTPARCRSFRRSPSSGTDVSFDWKRRFPSRSLRYTLWDRPEHGFRSVPGRHRNGRFGDVSADRLRADLEGGRCPEPRPAEGCSARGAGVMDDAIYEDQASGQREDRPGPGALLKAARQGDVIVVWRLDRLGRNLCPGQGGGRHRVQERAGELEPRKRTGRARQGTPAHHDRDHAGRHGAVPAVRGQSGIQAAAGKCGVWVGVRGMRRHSCVRCSNPTDSRASP